MGPSHTSWLSSRYTSTMFPARSRSWFWIIVIILGSESHLGQSCQTCLGKGIITGCTISVILFALAINMVVKTTEVECRRPLSRSGARQPPTRGYIDKLTITTTSVPGSRWFLQGLERLIAWARMSCPPSYTPKAEGAGRGRGNRKSRLGLLPKDPNQPGSRQGETPPTPGRGPSRCGGRACEQGSGTPTAGSMDKVGEHGVAQSHLVKHLPGSLWCPPEPIKPPCMGED